MSLRQSLLLLLLVAFLLPLTWTPAGAQEAPPFTADFPPEEFQARRERVLDAIGPNAIAVIQGAPSPRGYARFRQSNEFYYLTGVEVAHSYLLLDGTLRRSLLFVPHRNEARERGEGRLLAAEDLDFIRETLGFDGAAGVEELADVLARMSRLRMKVDLYTPFQPAEGLAESRDLGLRTNADIASDPWDGRPSREGHFIQLLQSRFPVLGVHDLSPILDSLRLIKSPREQELIRKATRLSGLALMESMRSTEPGITEHELDAVAKYIYYRNGAQGDAYYSLVAGGTNAYMPHYHAGRSVLRAEDLVLMDYAPDVGYYMSDVTRMWPVDGSFSQWQRELYGFYLAAYRAILDRIRPGVTAAQIRREAGEEMERLLAGATFTAPHHRSAAERFVADYVASGRQTDSYLGHWVGMATHDVGSYTGPLMPGMVFTIEPALRVPEERIYIRLEDLIIIHEDRAEIVSDFVPMEIEAIEQLMAEPGMLQRYPGEGR